MTPFSTPRIEAQVDVSEAQPLHQMEDENRRLKQRTQAQNRSMLVAMTSKGMVASQHRGVNNADRRNGPASKGSSSLYDLEAWLKKLEERAPNLWELIGQPGKHWNCTQCNRSDIKL